MDNKESIGKRNPQNHSQMANKVASQNTRLLERAFEIAEENKNSRDSLVESRCSNLN